MNKHQFLPVAVSATTSELWLWHWNAHTWGWRTGPRQTVNMYDNYSIVGSHCRFPVGAILGYGISTIHLSFVLRKPITISAVCLCVGTPCVLRAAEWTDGRMDGWTRGGRKQNNGEYICL